MSDATIDHTGLIFGHSRQDEPNLHRDVYNRAMSDDDANDENEPAAFNDEPITDSGWTVDLWPFMTLSCEIPREFHSLADGPFTRCMVCDADLIEGDVRYLVERIFRGSEPIVEYAMCVACQEGMCSELSQESLQAIQEYYQQVDFDARVDRLRNHLAATTDPSDVAAAFQDSAVLDVDVSPWLDSCLVTGKPRSECHGHQVIALCQGQRLELSVVPIMISNEAIEGLLKVISKKTRDRLDDFMGENFGMPPEFCEQPDMFPVLL